jgi:enoyl-CoA hydratase
MEYRSLRLALEPPIARLTLTNGRGNLLDSRLLRELEDAAAAIASTDAIALVKLDAAGPDFCLGWQPQARDGLPAGVADVFAFIAGLPCPVVAVIQGKAQSGGLELALAADVRVCSALARFACPDVSHGRRPRAGGSQRLPRIVGRSLAAAMLLLGDELDAGAALAAGLVSRVFHAASLAQDSDGLAQRIATRGPIALRYAKEAVHNGLDMSLEQGLLYELDLSVILQTTADRAEGVRAFLEKRPPQFDGR